MLQQLYYVLSWINILCIDTVIIQFLWTYVVRYYLAIDEISKLLLTRLLAYSCFT